MLKFPMTKSTYMCNIETSTVANKFGFYKKSLTKGWFDFVADQKLKAGDKLQFEFYIYPIELKKLAEVETSFARDHIGQLNGYWKVHNNDTDFHKLKFNNNYDNPLIAQGWNEFKDFHEMPESVEIELIYHGNNVFEVLQFKQLITDNEIQPFQFETCTEIPAFHSRSIEPEKTVFFEIELNDLQIGLPEFKIPYAFATFLNQWHFEDLVLCAENGHMYSCRLKHHGSINRMKLMNWNQVCENQKLKAGHVIRFKFEKYSASISSRCHIFKLT
ncbi:hypothetical protein QL285_094154 [Trifolium repens]|nr:hypothetical protein QL285_094154 [Trifolium repens]